MKLLPLLGFFIIFFIFAAANSKSLLNHVETFHSMCYSCMDKPLRKLIASGDYYSLRHVPNDLVCNTTIGRTAFCEQGCYRITARMNGTVLGEGYGCNEDVVLGPKDKMIRSRARMDSHWHKSIRTNIEYRLSTTDAYVEFAKNKDSFLKGIAPRPILIENEGSTWLSVMVVVIIVIVLAAAGLLICWHKVKIFSHLSAIFSIFNGSGTDQTPSVHFQNN